MESKARRSKGITIFCSILIAYSLLIILFDLYVISIAHFSLPYLLKALYNCSKVLTINLFEIVLAIMLLRLTNTARKIFIIFASIFTILTILTSVNYANRHVPQHVEKFKQEQIELYKQKGETPKFLPDPVVFVVLGVIFNMPRVLWIIIYICGIILFTRPKIKEQFCKRIVVV